MPDWVIYGLKERGEPVRYVGKTKDPRRRLSGHLTAARLGAQQPVYCWLRGLTVAPELIIFEVGDGDGWRVAERVWIAAHTGLLNLSRGGNEPFTTEAGRLSRIEKLKVRHFSEEHRRKISEAKKGKPRPDNADRNRALWGAMSDDAKAAFGASIRAGIAGKKTDVRTDQRAAVVAEAMTWLKTKYHNGQALKGVGADCARFPLAVYAAAGMIPPTKVPDYPPDWNMHRNAEIYLDWVLRFAVEIGQKPEGGYVIEGQPPQPGDFVLWRWGRTYSHGGIVTAGTQIIHAARGIGVTLDDMQTHEDLRTRPARIFSVWG